MINEKAVRNEVSWSAYPAIEHLGSVFPNTRLDHSLSTRVLADEFAGIVHDACHGNETTAILGLVNVIVPFHDGKLI